MATKSEVPVTSEHFRKKYGTYGDPIKCNVQNNSAYIQFTSDLILNRPHIVGLQKNKILYEYTSSADDWTIHYQYYTNETLNVTCVSKTTETDLKLQWYNRGKIIHGGEHRFDTKYSLITMNGIFTLGDEENMTTIRCRVITTSAYYAQNKLEVILILHLSAENKVVDNNSQCIHGKYVDIQRKTRWCFTRWRLSTNKFLCLDMFRCAVIILFALPVLFIVTTECRTIQMNITDEKCLMDDTNYVLLEGEELIFRFVGQSTKYSGCQRYVSRNGILTKQSIKLPVIPGGLGVDKVSMDMSTRWTCFILTDTPPAFGSKTYTYKGRKFTAVKCKTTIHVRSKKNIFFDVTTQGKLMEMNIPDSFITDFDAVGIYYYQEGEIVSTECNNKYDFGNLKMIYRNATGSILFEIDEEKFFFNLKFRSYMTVERNGSYLDCLISPIDIPDTFVYRIYYMLRDRIRDPSIILINGLELVYNPSNQSGSPAAILYHYIDGEQLELVCKARDKQTTESEVITKHISGRYNGSEITEQCGTWDNPVDITFISDVNDTRQPRIAGLQKNRILYEYTSAREDWTIHYQYLPNEVLNLTCVLKQTDYADLKWIYRGVEMESGPQKIDEEYNIKTINRIFQLSDADDLTSLKCITDRSISRYWAPRRDPSVTLTLHKSSVQENLKLRVDAMISRDNNPDNYNQFIIIGMGFAVAVVVIAAVMICLALRKRRAPSSLPRNNDYQGINYTASPPLPPRRSDVKMDEKGYCIMQGKITEYYSKMHPFRALPRSKSVADPEMRTFTYECIFSDNVSERGIHVRRSSW